MSQFHYLFIIPFYKITSNAFYLYRTCQIIRKYNYWLLYGDNYVELLEQKRIFEKILSKADVNDKYLPITQPTGYGQLASFQSSIIAQFPSDLEAYAPITLKMLLEAKGIFKERILETFNPIYWIELAIFLPKHALMYLGIKPDNFIIKLVQLTWFLLAGAYSLLLALYPDAFRTLIERLPDIFH